MEWTDIRLTVAKADADNAEAVATMIAEGGIYIEDYSDIEQQVAEIAHVDLIEQELLDRPRDTVIIHMYQRIAHRVLQVPHRFLSGCCVHPTAVTHRRTSPLLP